MKLFFLFFRDLKPENILVQSNSKLKTKKESFPVLKIADFGLSKVGCGNLFNETYNCCCSL